MKVELGCRFEYRADAATPAVALVEPHTSLRADVLDERWEGPLAARYEDVYGNACQRLMLPPGESSFAYRATVRISPEPEAMPGPEDAQHRIEHLPSELLHWLLPSRLCESDALADEAWDRFGAVHAGAARVQAVCDWIHENLTYGVPTIPTTTAGEVLAQRGGMCRDFANLGVTFCRGLGIPARYVSGYLPDIGIPGPYPTMDFHAWFDVWLGARWWPFDARFNEPRIGRVATGHGRDAVDVAMVTTYGPASLERMTVRADEVELPVAEAQDAR